jgi:DNA-directed RNA polymerase specialized sigma24 family protein
VEGAVETRQRARIQEDLTALAAGDRSAYRPVFAALWPLMRRFCERSLRDPDLAQDAAQTALMKLFLHAAEFEPDRDPVAWALGFAAFECRTTRNRVAGRREERDAGLLAALPAGAPSPEDATLEAELQRAAAELLGSLRPQDAATLHAALGGSRPTGSPVFRKRLQRALERLRVAWRHTHGSHD